MKRILVSQKEFGKFIDVTPKWIQELERRAVFKKTAGRYDLQESVRAYVTFLRGSRDKTLAEAQRLNLQMKTKKLQLEAKRLEGSLVPRTDRDKQIDFFVQMCEENFRNLESRVIPILAMIPDPQNELKLMSLILKHEKEACWRDLAGFPKNETPVVLPNEMILLSLGLIKGDANGEVIVEGSHSRREKVSDLLAKYGSGIEALKIPEKEIGE